MRRTKAAALVLLMPLAACGDDGNSTGNTNSNGNEATNTGGHTGTELPRGMSRSSSTRRTSRRAPTTRTSPWSQGRSGGSARQTPREASRTLW